MFLFCSVSYYSGRGYVNGLLEQAKACKMRIIGLTVGRRDADKNLRALSEEELKEVEQNLGGAIPLEAGFDSRVCRWLCSPGRLERSKIKITNQYKKKLRL